MTQRFQMKRLFNKTGTNYFINQNGRSLLITRTSMQDHKWRLSKKLTESAETLVWGTSFLLSGLLNPAEKTDSRSSSENSQREHFFGGQWSKQTVKGLVHKICLFPESWPYLPPGTNLGKYGH